MMALYGTYKWCLSGTPIRNYETGLAISVHTHMYIYVLIIFIIIII